MSKKIVIAIYTLVLLFGFNSFTYSQSSIVAEKKEDLAKMKFQGGIIERQGIVGVFSHLSFRYDIPIGVEIALNDDNLAKYEIDFYEGTLPQLLNQIISQINQSKNQYVWEINDGVVNIYPKGFYQDKILNSLLEVKINRFSVKKDTSCKAFADSLGSSPEIKEYFLSYGLNYFSTHYSGFYQPQLGREFMLETSDMTVKSILNRVVKESPIAKFWYIKRRSYDLNTFTIGLNSKIESSIVFAPTGPGPVGF